MALKRLGNAFCQATTSDSSRRQGYQSATGLSPTKVIRSIQNVVQPGPSALSRVSNKSLLRSLLLTSMMTRNWIMKPSLAFLDLVTKRQGALFNPDRNHVLNRVFRWTIYNHFCAGNSNTEVASSMHKLKALGYQGVILGHARELVIDPDSKSFRKTRTTDDIYSPGCYQMVEEWKQLNLNTLRMLQPGDFLALKLTGAGPICADALQARQPMPEVIKAAVEAICIETKQRGTRLWVDAEQQIFQVGLDEWIIELMRKFNRNGEALVYNTIQAYLKGATANAERHITLAAKEGWTAAIKLVRGAYIEHEVRALIHDNKEATDRSYDVIAEAIISQRLPRHLEGEEGGEPTTRPRSFPQTALFLATHNKASAEKAIELHASRIRLGLPLTHLECGQIMGMADELSCALLQSREKLVACNRRLLMRDDTMVPRIFKFMAVGTVAECLGYLHRRAIENQGAVQRTRHMVEALKKELRRRVMG